MKTRVFIFVLSMVLVCSAAYAAPVWNDLPVIVMDEEVTNDTIQLNSYIASGCDLGCTFTIDSSSDGVTASIIGQDTLEIDPNSDYHGQGWVVVNADDGSEDTDHEATLKVLSIPDLGTDVQLDDSYFDGDDTTDLSLAEDNVEGFQNESDPDAAYQNSVYFFSLERDLIGKVTFEGYFPFIWDLLLSQSNVVIDNGFIAVDSDSIFGWASYWIDHPPATVELYDVDASNYETNIDGEPVIYTDEDFHQPTDSRETWNVCSGDCEPISYDSETKTLTFKVNQFSSFGLQGQGGDGGGEGVPEFSTIGLILMLVIIALGMSLIIKKRR